MLPGEEVERCCTTGGGMETFILVGTVGRGGGCDREGNVGCMRELRQVSGHRIATNCLFPVKFCFLNVPHW